jgi:hypothetical protein
MAEVEQNTSDPLEETQVEEPKVTPEETTEPSPTPESGNEGVQEESQEQENVDWKKRYSDSSREASKFKETAEQNQKELLTFVTRNRDTFEQYVDSKGLPPMEKERYMNIYDTQIAPSANASTSEAAKGVTGELESGSSPSKEQAAPNKPVDPVRQSWMNRMDMQEREKIEEQSKATMEFFEREENKALPYNIQEAIRSTAAMLDQEFGYKPADALSVARKRLLEPEALRDEGYNQGVKDSMVGGVNRGFTGSNAKEKEQIKLPAKDEAYVSFEIQRKGLKGDEAEKYRKAYAERLAMKN